MQSNLVYIADVSPLSLAWSVKVCVEEKMKPRQSTEGPTSYQKIILCDKKGSKVVGPLYQRDIGALRNTLLVGGTYIISKARVDHVAEQYRIVDKPYQWIINSSNAILRAIDELFVQPSRPASLTKLSSLPGLVGSRTLINVLVIVIDKLAPRSIVSKGHNIFVQDLGVTDTELKPFVLTLWGDLASNFGSTLKVFRLVRPQLRLPLSILFCLILLS